MTIISFIAINFGAIYRTTKSSYRDSPRNNNKIPESATTIDSCIDKALVSGVMREPQLTLKEYKDIFIRHNF